MSENVFYASPKSIRPENGCDINHNIFFHAIALEVMPNYVNDPADRYRIEQDFKTFFTMCKGGNLGRRFVAESKFVTDNKVEVMALYSLATGTKMGDASMGQIGDWLFSALFFRGNKTDLPDKYRSLLHNHLEREFLAWLYGKMTAPKIWEDRLKKVLNLTNAMDVYAQKFLGSPFGKFEPLISRDIDAVRKYFSALEYDHRRLAANVPMNWGIAYL